MNAHFRTLIDTVKHGFSRLDLTSSINQLPFCHPLEEHPSFDPHAQPVHRRSSQETKKAIAVSQHPVPSTRKVFDDLSNLDLVLV